MYERCDSVKTSEIRGQRMSAVPRTVVLLQLLAARLVSSGPLSHPVSGTSRRLGQCAGLAYNYHRAVAAHQDCLQLCDCDREGLGL